MTNVRPAGGGRIEAITPRHQGIRPVGRVGIEPTSDGLCGARIRPLWLCCVLLKCSQVPEMSWVSPIWEHVGNTGLDGSSRRRSLAVGATARQYPQDHQRAGAGRALEEHPPVAHAKAKLRSAGKPANVTYGRLSRDTVDRVQDPPTNRWIEPLGGPNGEGQRYHPWLCCVLLSGSQVPEMSWVSPIRELVGNTERSGCMDGRPMNGGAEPARRSCA